MRYGGRDVDDLLSMYLLMNEMVNFTTVEHPSQHAFVNVLSRLPLHDCRRFV